MTVQLNHLIVFCSNAKRSAAFLADILGLAPARAFSVFQVVDLDNGVSLDFDELDTPIQPSHYAFLIGEKQFDQVFARISERELTYWADPGKRQAGRINHHDGGRGLYFEDPDYHLLEVITRPYGSGG